MNLHASTDFPVDPPAGDAGGYFKAMLNILGDVDEDKARLQETQRAMLNILGDVDEDRARLQETQRAMLNILEDADAERSERRRAEEEVRRLNDELEARVQQRTAELKAAITELEGYSYSIAHDLRIPLRAIDGFSHLLLEEYEHALDEEARRYLHVVRDNTKRMAQYIDGLLAFARLGRVRMLVSNVDMGELVHEVLEELGPAYAGRELAVELKPLPHARGDRGMLHEVWANLLDNAIKFTRPREHALVEVGGRTEGTENIYYVRDNGVGFDMQYVDKMFGVFQRLHGVEEFEGGGIGLAIVKRIVTRHGGRVWAEGKVNEGATLFFALPVS